MTRIVKISFKPEYLDLFFEFIEPYRSQIAGFPGCQSLEFLQSIEDKYTIITYSVWNDASDLEAYRSSPLFEQVWSQVKPWFSTKPEAWSMDSIYSST